jgi:hypothetical protein
MQAPPPSQPLDLCIDSRKPKRPLGSENYNLNEMTNDVAESDINQDFPYG